MFFVAFLLYLEPFCCILQFLRLFVAESELRTFLEVKLSKKLSEADNSKNANLSAFNNFFDNLTSRNVRISDSATKMRKKL